MTRDEAMAVVIEAAESWAAEIQMFIIPGGEPAETWEPRAHAIYEAVHTLKKAKS